MRSIVDGDGLCVAVLIYDCHYDYAVLIYSKWSCSYFRTWPGSRQRAVIEAHFSWLSPCGVLLVFGSFLLQAHVNGWWVVPTMIIEWVCVFVWHGRRCVCVCVCRYVTQMLMRLWAVRHCWAANDYSQITHTDKHNIRYSYAAPFRICDANISHHRTRSIL